MKKLLSMALVFVTLVTLSISAFATNSNFETLTPDDLSHEEEFEALKPEELIQDEEFEILTPEETASTEETEDPDDLLEVCPKCGKIHDGCCEEEAIRIHFRHYTDSKFAYLKYCDMKGDALYFVTLDNKLMLMNLKTKQLYFIADEVMGLTRYGMNGRYIGYVTLNDKFFSVPYEVGKDGKLSTDFQMEFGE